MQDKRTKAGLHPHSKVILIGLTGKAGAGKDTIANALVYYHSFQQYALANPIKDMVSVMLGVQRNQWEDRAWKEQNISWLGKSPRELAQTLGTEWGREVVHQELWLRLMLKRWAEVKASANPKLVISDVRFDNEAKAIIKAGGTVWRVDREVPSVAKHKSEAGVSPQHIMGTVKNYGTLEQLESQMQYWGKFLLARYAK